MSKRVSNQFDKECPICGGKIWGKGQKVLIEEAKITVCQSCAQHGKKIRNEHEPKRSYSQQQTYVKLKSPVKKFVPKRDGDENIEIIHDYAKRIRNARNSRGFNQDQFAQKLNEKPSLPRRIEAGKVEPTIKLAKKIEKVYNITLLKKIDEIEPSAKQSKYMKKSRGSSLGDIAFITKKKD